MRVLFLDDDDRWHKEFKRAAVGDLIDRAYSAREAILLLRDNAYDRVYLDHDLDDYPARAMDDSIPTTMGACADRWLAEIKAKLPHDDFRIVPPKIKQFVDCVGATTTVADFGRLHWNLWVRHLRLQVAAGETAANTARTTYGRSRELVRWLQANAGATAIHVLEVSGTVALKNS